MKIFSLALFVFIVISGCPDPNPDPIPDPDVMVLEVSEQCGFKITIPQEKITFTCQCVRFKWEKALSASPRRMASCARTPPCPKKISCNETCSKYGLVPPMEDKLSEACIHLLVYHHLDGAVASNLGK